MVPIALQDFLVGELKRLFYGQTFLNPEGEQSPLNVFAQSLPVKTVQTPESKIFPHIRVILIDGEDADEESPNTCRIALQVGVYDKGTDHQGHRDIAHITQVIYDHLMSNRVFDNQYRVEYPFRWNFYDEDTAPYFFGEIETNWIVGKITQWDDDLA